MQKKRSIIFVLFFFFFRFIFSCALFPNGVVSGKFNGRFDLNSSIEEKECKNHFSSKWGLIISTRS